MQSSETTAHKLKTLGNHPKEKYDIQNTAKDWNKKYWN